MQGFIQWGEALGMRLLFEHSMNVIGASLSEPHTSVLNGGFSYINNNNNNNYYYYYYYHYYYHYHYHYHYYYISAIRMSLRKCKLRLF